MTVKQMESRLDHPCPQCYSKENLKMLTFSSEIPYFGEHTQISIVCESCGWKHTDFIPSDGEKPGLWRLQIDDKEKMSARVIRSSSCTIRIETLELEVSPGSSSSGYVSNIEGVLNRFIDAISIVMKEDDANISTTANNLIRTLESAKDGCGALNIVLLDPKGRSQIIHKDVISRELTEDEGRSLQTGFEIPVLE